MSKLDLGEINLTIGWTNIRPDWSVIPNGKMQLLLISFLYLLITQGGRGADVEAPEEVNTSEALQHVLDTIGKIPEDARQGQPVIQFQGTPQTTDLGSVQPAHETVLIVNPEDK